MLNVFINTWGNYNENGADGGEWVALPMDADALRGTLARIAAQMGDNDPEFCIHDYEYTGDIDFENVGENDNIFELNELIQQLEALDKWDIETVAAAVEAFGYDLPEAIEKTERGYFIMYHGMDLEEVAEGIVNECYFTRDTPDILTRYFDYAAFARDLSFDGYTETEWGVIIDG